MRVAGVVLAGGRSSRMDGRDKAFVPLTGRPLVAWAIDRLERQVPTLAVNSNAEASAFNAFGKPVIPDTIPGFPGPLGGVLAGFEWAAPRHDAVVTVAVDTPFFPRDLVARLAAGDGCRVAASAGRLHPTFALWPVSLVEPLRFFLANAGTGRVTAFLERQGFDAVDFPLAGPPSERFDPFFNVNTPADLETAERVAAAMP